MKKLVCESLQEFNAINEADDEKSGWGPLSGAVHAVKTAPGRVLRKARAIDVMKRYKGKIIRKIEKIIPKYLPNIQKLVDTTQKRINEIKANTDEQEKNQKRQILDDLETNMKELLTTVKNSMSEQLKVYAESFHNRLEREGTITGVKFYPEEKTNLLSRWKSIEDQVNSLIQKKIIELIDNVKIEEFQQMKAELEEYIDGVRGYSSPEPEQSSDVDLISPETKDYEALIKLKYLNYSIDHAYPLIKPEAIDFEEGKLSTRNRIKFSVDNSEKKIVYKYYKPNAKNVLLRDERFPARFLIKKEDTGEEWKDRLEKIQLATGPIKYN